MRRDNVPRAERRIQEALAALARRVADDLARLRLLQDQVQSLSSFKRCDARMLKTDGKAQENVAYFLDGVIAHLVEDQLNGVVEQLGDASTITPTKLTSQNAKRRASWARLERKMKQQETRAARARAVESAKQDAAVAEVKRLADRVVKAGSLCRRDVGRLIGAYTTLLRGAIGVIERHHGADVKRRTAA
jgi:hypothetical protein